MKLKVRHYLLGKFDNPHDATDAMHGCFMAISLLRFTVEERTAIKFYIDQQKIDGSWQWELYVYNVPNRFRSAFGAYNERLKLEGNGPVNDSNAST